MVGQLERNWLRKTQFLWGLLRVGKVHPEKEPPCWSKVSEGQDEWPETVYQLRGKVAGIYQQ